MEGHMLINKRSFAASAIVIAISASGVQACGNSENSPGAVADASPPGIPHDVPKAAAKAMEIARKWHADAQLFDLSVKQSNNYAIEFNFRSPSTPGYFYVMDAKDKFTSQAMPPVTTSAEPDQLPLDFLDLPAAIAKAEERGMPHIVKQAELQASSSQDAKVAWAIQPVTDDAPYLYTVDAASGAVSSAGQWNPGEDPNNTRTVNRPK
jgi:hypothetical protein